MAQVPDRDELERKFARALAKLFASMSGDLVAGLGDPPNIANLPAEFWEEFGAGLSAEMYPFLSSVFVAQAGALIAQTNLGVDWTLINQAAADWAKLYTNTLVSQLTETTIEGVGEAVASFFEDALTRGELEDLLLQSFGPVRAETIAVTEVTRAASEGEQAIARELAEAGIQMIPIWQTNNDELVCEEFDGGPGCVPRHGQVIEDGIYPPLHPRCRCWTNHELPKVEQ